MRADDLPDRVREKILQRPDGCWEWTGSTTKGGYANMGWQGKTVYVHRFSYEALVGLIPEGLQIDHLCRNRSCVNPEHMEPVTNQQNVSRGVRGEGPRDYMGRFVSYGCCDA